MDSRKYGRTYHYTFSPGTTSDDRFNYEYWEDIQKFDTLVHTEKLDGENNCLSQRGVFARSHAAPTTSAWTSQLRQRWELIKHDLGELEIFGENLYAIHSIRYKAIEEYFYVFAVRCKDTWLSWEEVQFYASVFDLPTVPLLETVKTKDLSKNTLENRVCELASLESIFESYDTINDNICTREGIVSRNIKEFQTKDFKHNIFKYVRKGHVKTDEHWIRNWKRAPLKWEDKRD